MKLKVLVDNNTAVGNYVSGEPGLSFYLEDGASRILFDTGYSDLFMRNAALFGQDLNLVDTIVLSHGHGDHTRGLNSLLESFDLHNKRLIAHPDAVREKQRAGAQFGITVDMQTLASACQLVLTKEPMRISGHLMFLGEIPPYYEFEKHEPLGECLHDGGFVPDMILDDSALVYESPRGLYIITGCTHSGICNMIRYAQHVCGDTRVCGVIGGLHLLSDNEQTQRTARFFLEQGIKELYPCHCTSFMAKSVIHQQVPIHEVTVGTEIEL